MMYFLVAETVFQTELANREKKTLEHSLTHFTPPLTCCRTLIDKGKAALALEENGRED